MLLVLLAAASATMAQTEPSKSKGKANGFSFGIGLDGAIPMGALKEAPSSYKIGGGGNLRFTQGITENFDLTLTGGAIAFIPEDLNNKTIDTKISVFIPIKLGGRIMLGDTFYVMGEAGLTLTKVYQAKTLTITGTTGTTTEGFVNGSTFVYAPGIGVRFGGFDLGLRYEGISDINGGKTIVLPTGTPSSSKTGGFLGLRIGYDF
ncbi:hypothetical protein D9M68_638510 [compost metagenome]